MSRRSNRRDFDLMQQAAKMIGRLVEQRGALPLNLRVEAHGLVNMIGTRAIEGLRDNPTDVVPTLRPGEREFAEAIADRRFPDTFGGSPSIAGEYGQLAMFAARANYPETAYWLARWAAREAIAYCERLDRSLGRPFELYQTQA